MVCLSLDSDAPRRNKLNGFTKDVIDVIKNITKDIFLKQICRAL
jgi:hypothetical protein